MKKIVAIVMAALLLLCFVSCREKTPAEKTDVRVTALKGPTGMGMASLMAENENGTTQNNYTFTLASAPAEVQSTIISGNFDIAAVPVNLASVLYNKGADISFIGVATLGVLYVLENGNSINSVADLKGKTIYATGQGATPEYALNFILEKNGLKAGKDVTVEFLSDHAELASKLAANAVSIGVLPEPNVTSALIQNTGDLRIALNLTKEWNKVSDTTLVQGVLVASNKFLSEHPKAVETFLSEYKKSVNIITSDIEKGAEYCEKYGIVPKAAIAKKAIPNCNISAMTGDDGVSAMKGMLDVLYKANPASVGGKLPKDDFYKSIEIK
ncbi:MAG: ABC transporter substrate-binding protein [Eubacteriales bacterium]|nr:ABC transporter substrate-binding protein [Eubacteriales bacterium]